MTNAEALRAGITPCETNPLTGGLSRTVDEFHAAATITCGTKRIRTENLKHACVQCAKQYHTLMRQRDGVLWL